MIEQKSMNTRLLGGLLAVLRLCAGQQEVSVDFNQNVNVEGVTLEDTLVFTVQAGVEQIILYNDGDSSFVSCAGNDPVEDYAEVVATVVDNEATVELSDLGLDSDIETLVFGQVDGNDECIEFFATVSLDTLAPTFAPTFAPSLVPTSEPTGLPTTEPTQSPTTQPTNAPVERLNTLIPWNNPNELSRFSTSITLTVNEEITFSVLATHNLIEFPDKESFDDCNFTDIPEENFIVDGVTEDATILFDEIGSIRWFGCNLPDTVSGDNHCLAFGQKIAITTVARGAAFELNWFVPANDAERAGFATNQEITPDQSIRFNQQAADLNIRQFTSKEAFDNCEFFAGNLEDFLRDGNPSFEVGDLSEDNNELLYRDFLQGTAGDQQDILWFGSDDIVDCDGQQVTACECGLKKAFNVVEVLGVNNGDGEDDDDDDDASIIPIVGGIVGGFAFVGVMVFLAIRKNQPEFEPKGGNPPQQHYPQQDIVQSPYASKASMPGSPPPGLENVGGVRSLAKTGNNKGIDLDF